MQDSKTSVTNQITPIRKEPAPIAPTDDRYVLVDKGDYNRLVNNASGSNMLIICGLASFLIGAAALVMTGLRPETVITQEKPIVIEKPVIVQCGLFGCSKKE